MSDLVSEIILPEQKFCKEESMILAFEYYKMGWSFRRIARELRVTHPTVLAWVTEVLDELADYRKKLGIRYIEGELATSGDLMAGILPAAKSGDYNAVDRVIKILDRRAKYLGLDAPTKVAPTSPDGTMPYVELSAAELRRRIGPLAGAVPVAPDSDRVSPDLS